MLSVRLGGLTGFYMRMAHSLSANGRWVDRLAVSMAVICAIHCLVTPVLLVALPIIGTTFWVSEDFHIWMLLLVLPTTLFAVTLGCRKHKDRWVMGAAAVGIALLIAAVAIEGHAHAATDHWAAHGHDLHGHEAHGHEAMTSAHVSTSSEGGAGDVAGALHYKEGFTFHTHALLNVLGGMFLVLGHTRNYRLCRRARCACACG